MRFFSRNIQQVRKADLECRPFVVAQVCLQQVRNTHSTFSVIFTWYVSGNKTVLTAVAAANAYAVLIVCGALF